MEEHFVFIASDDAADIYPDNKYSDFTVTLPRGLKLQNTNAEGERLRWTVSLTDIYIAHPEFSALGNSDIAILSSVANETYIGGEYSPILRVFPRAAVTAYTLGIPFYIGTNTNRIESIRMQIIALRGGSLPSHRENSVTGCSLHFMANHI